MYATRSRNTDGGQEQILELSSWSRTQKTIPVFCTDRNRERDRDRGRVIGWLWPIIYVERRDREGKNEKIQRHWVKEEIQDKMQIKKI